MPLIWLRVALVCYAVGLLYALVALTRTSEILSKLALHASYLGMVFHFVSLTEAIVQSGQLASASVHNAESLLAFLIMVVSVSYTHLDVYKRQIRNWSYDVLEREVRANLVYRAFTRIGDEKVPDAKTLRCV